MEHLVVTLTLSQLSCLLHELLNHALFLSRGAATVARWRVIMRNRLRHHGSGLSLVDLGDIELSLAFNGLPLGTVGAQWAGVTVLVSIGTLAAEPGITVLLLHSVLELLWLRCVPLFRMVSIKCELV